MRDLMELLCEYAQNRRMTGYLDRQIYREAQRLEEKNLRALQTGPSSEQTAALERYQDACRERHAMELEAMFCAAFSITWELH